MNDIEKRQICNWKFFVNVSNYFHISGSDSELVKIQNHEISIEHTVYSLNTKFQYNQTSISFRIYGKFHVVNSDSWLSSFEVVIKSRENILDIVFFSSDLKLRHFFYERSFNIWTDKSQTKRIFFRKRKFA